MTTPDVAFGLRVKQPLGHGPNLVDLLDVHDPEEIISRDQGQESVSVPVTVPGNCHAPWSRTLRWVTGTVTGSEHQPSPRNSESGGWGGKAGAGDGI